MTAPAVTVEAETTDFEVEGPTVFSAAALFKALAAVPTTFRNTQRLLFWWVFLDSNKPVATLCLLLVVKNQQTK